MHTLKKSAAAILTFALILTGCSQKSPDKSGKEAADTPSGSTVPLDLNSNPNAADPDTDTNADPMDSSSKEAMLLEHDVPLPDMIGKKETVISIVTNGKQGIELFSHDQKNNIYQYIRKEDDWSKQELHCPDQIRESAGLDRLDLLRQEDGRYYAFYALSDETYHLQATDDLKIFEDLTPPQWRGGPDSRDYVIPAKILVSKNGILCAILKYEDLCRMYDLKNDGTILDEFGIASYAGLSIHENQLISETIGSSGNFIYDIEKQKNILEIEDGLSSNAVYEMLSPEEIYACNDNGIYHLSSGKWQLLVDSSLNNLSDPNFIWQKLQHDGERIYITYQSAQSLADGKTKEGFVLKYYEYSKDIPKMDTTLTIWGLKENAYIKSVLAEFRKEHPNVRVVYEIASDTSGVMTANDIIRQFNADIFAGNGPDVILLDGLHMETYAERGLLYDIGKDLDSIKPELTAGVQTLLEENSYAVPLRMSLPFVIAQKELLDDSLESFLQKSSGQKSCEMTAEDLFDVCYHFFSEGLALNKTDVTKEELVTFLNLCQKASENWLLTESPKREFHYDDGSGWMELGMEEADFTFSYAYGLNQFSDLLDSIDQLSARGFDYHSTEHSFVPQGMLAINEQSENKELSIEFIQKALSARLQESDLSDGFPVNTQALDSWSSRHSDMMTAVGDQNGNEWDTQWPSDEMLKRFLQSVKEAGNAVFIERYTQELVKSEAVKVISGDTSAEDAAARIQNQLELFYES